jgi:hypothetical protein
MKTLTIEKTQKELEEFRVAYIIHDGFYSYEDGLDELNEHTEVTQQLYAKALKDSYSGEIAPDDYLQAVSITEDIEISAEWLINGSETYVPMAFNE